ncbi:MAG: hypothetical protein L0170_04725, partial [Acidobacteria bacterium]|nr:hypothetical protein [Acidobacteriota bacterium]
LIVGDEADDCWVPQSELASAEALAAQRPDSGEDRFRIELDISWEEFEDHRAWGLRDAGLLAPLEAGDGVIGVLVSLHPDEVKSIPALLRGYLDDGSLLDDAVAELLRGLITALPDRPELMEFFRNHPDEQEERDDTSVDESDLDEMGSDVIVD